MCGCGTGWQRVLRRATVQLALSGPADAIRRPTFLTPVEQTFLSVQRSGVNKTDRNVCPTNFSRATSNDPDRAITDRRCCCYARSKSGKISLSGKTVGIGRVCRQGKPCTHLSRPSREWTGRAARQLRRKNAASLLARDDPAAVRLLQREALVGQNVSHPHLMPVLAASVIDPPRLLVMPWLDGASLQARLAAGEMFSVPRALLVRPADGRGA